MKTIYKYIIKTTDIQQISMPQGALILTVQTQHGIPCIWAEVDTDRQKENRTIEIFGTGNPIPENADRKYIGTYQLNAGEFVFHVYELFKLN